MQFDPIDLVQTIEQPWIQLFVHHFGLRRLVAADLPSQADQRDGEAEDKEQF